MNIIEKKMPKALREHLQVVIAAALGFFLGLRYSSYLTKLLQEFLPETNSLLIEGIILVGITIIVVYVTIGIRRALDGK